MNFLSPRLQGRPSGGRSSACIRQMISPRLLVAAATANTYPLPRNVQEMIDEAAEAVIRASEKHQRHLVELINPINEKKIDFLSTEAMDYPESNFSEFNSIVGLSKSLVAILAGNRDMELNVKRIDEGGIDGDLCAVVSTPDLSVVCMVWPTAQKLKALKQLAENKKIGQLLVVNALWKTSGQLVSEFGVGPWRKANEDFLATFEGSYSLYEQRIGAPSSVNLAKGARYEDGGVVRVQRCFPGSFEVHIMSPNGVSQAIGSYPVKDGKPTYKQLEGLILQGRQAKMEIFNVARKASTLAIERGDPPPEGEEPKAASFYSRDQILNMDLSRLRRALLPLGLPTSGALGKLQARALAVADAMAEGQSLEQGVEVAKKLR